MTPSRKEVLRDRAYANPQCAECVSRLDSPEVYTVTRYRDRVLLAFDIELAHQFCRDGREPKEVPPEALDAILQVNGITAEHVQHVDTTYPGIACPVDRTPEGELVFGLIDGSHRATRCRQEGKPFFAYHLTAEEAQLCQATSIARTAAQLEALLRGSVCPTVILSKH